MKCPECNSEDIKFQFAIFQTSTKDFIDAELYCHKCKEVTAFHRIKQEDWIQTNI